MGSKNMSNESYFKNIDSILNSIGKSNESNERLEILISNILESKNISEFNIIYNYIFEEIYDEDNKIKPSTRIVILAGLQFYFNKKFNEFSIHREFENNIKTYLPNYKIIKQENTNGNIPDFFVKKDSLISPVEIKKNNFDKKALQQLLKYMKNYNSEYGFAIAPKLTADLPKNIKFIKIDMLNQ